MVELEERLEGIIISLVKENIDKSCEVKRDSDLFELGVDSLTLYEILDDIEDKFKIKIPINDGINVGNNILWRHNNYDIYSVSDLIDFVKRYNK